ncbi:hypothetical protein EV121DRAFT_274622 [Schizophyllum commune]
MYNDVLSMVLGGPRTLQLVAPSASAPLKSKTACVIAMHVGRQEKEDLFSVSVALSHSDTRQSSPSIGTMKTGSNASRNVARVVRSNRSGLPRRLGERTPADLALHRVKKGRNSHRLTCISNAPAPTEKKMHRQNAIFRTYFDVTEAAIEAPPAQLHASVDIPDGKDLYVFYVNHDAVGKETQVWTLERREEEIRRAWHLVEIGEEPFEAYSVLGGRLYVSQALPGEQ